MKKIITIFSVCVLSILIFGVATFAASDYQTFTPYHGNVYTRISNGTKYATIRVKWNEKGIKEFDSAKDTFEQDLIFYNYDNTAFASSISSYESELPNTYVDTQAFDSNNELNCSVGTTSANKIVADKMYYTYVTLK